MIILLKKYSLINCVRIVIEKTFTNSNDFLKVLPQLFVQVVEKCGVFSRKKGEYFFKFYSGSEMKCGTFNTFEKVVKSTIPRFFLQSIKYIFANIEYKVSPTFLLKMC